MNNLYLDGVMGLIVGDALGVPVEFKNRLTLKLKPVTDMTGHGTYNQPKGTWSDDSSMTLATLDSLKRGNINPDNIMTKFVYWFSNAEYTPYDKIFDIGNTCRIAILEYMKTRNINNCGRKGESDNGNGSLMRILPICIYLYKEQQKENLIEKDIIEEIHKISALTHAHIRSKIACGLYYFLVKNILNNKDKALNDCLNLGMKEGFTFYRNYLDVQELKELNLYSRIENVNIFKEIHEENIKSSGYVVDTLEAAIWCLLNTNNYKDCVLKAVNLGGDTDTVAAIAGGLAGLYYGYENIPEEWINILPKKDWIIGLCNI